MNRCGLGGRLAVSTVRVGAFESWQGRVIVSWCGGVSGGCVERGWVVVIVVVVFGTLLGPEITGPRFVVVSCPGGCVSWFSCGGSPLRGGRGVCRLRVRWLRWGGVRVVSGFPRRLVAFSPVMGVPFGGGSRGGGGVRV